MRLFVFALVCCLFAAACSQGPPSESAPGTYTLDKEQLEENLVQRTMQGEEMQAMLDSATAENREAARQQLAEEVRSGMGQSVSQMDWTLYLQEDGTFAMTSATGNASQRDSMRGSWTLSSDSLLALTTSWENGQPLPSDTTREAIYRDDVIYMENDSIAPGLRVAMNKQ